MSKNYNSRFTPSEEEMEKQKQEALKELIKINNDVKKEKKRKNRVILKLNRI